MKEEVSRKYIDNGSFMEFISEMATKITEVNFGADTWVEHDTGMSFSEEAQDYYNEKYDDYEMMANNIMGIYSINDLKLQR